MSQTPTVVPDLPSSNDMRGEIERCVAACLACADACGDACLTKDVGDDRREFMTVHLNCADVCLATARVLSRRMSHDAETTRTMLRACAEICDRCAISCSDHHAEMPGSRECAERCRHCAQSCRGLLAA